MKNISLKGLVLGLFVSIVSVMECTISAAPGYVDDPSVSVPAGAYTTFSTVYNGKRYYLGIDTIKAASGIDTVAAYDRPCYAAMWKVDSLYSPNGARLADKKYQRTIQSVWIEEKCSGRKRYLSLGENKGTYSAIVLRDAAAAAMWYTEQDNSEQSKYIQGYLYYHSDATSVYRYLTYDPLYGFRRAYARKPSASQRISVWDRKTGKDLVFSVSPSTITFDLTKMSENITAQLAYYDNVDRFRSRFDRTDIYVSRSAAVTSPDVLMAAPYNMTFHYSWKSNPINHDHMDTYDGNSMMPCYTITSYDDADQPVWGWSTFPVVHVANNTMTHDATTWRDVVSAVGAAPIDNPSRRLLRKPADSSAPVEGTYVNQNDWLYIHFYINGEAQEYKDSIYVVRQAFHNEKYAKIELNAVDPLDENILVEGHVFPYTYNNKKADGTTPVQNSDVEFSFNVAGRYESDNIMRNSINIIVKSSLEESGPLEIATSPCYRDTLWTDDAKTSYDDIVLYDTVLVSVLNLDGKPCDWIESVTLPARNQVKVRVEQFETEEIASRTAQIQYTYRYRHSSATGDWAVQTRTMWITQEGKGAHDEGLYSFNHKGELDSKGLQAVHEKHNTLYAVPGEPLNLPVHHDLWGYYRWFSYDDETMDKAVTYNNKWSFTAKGIPTNEQGTAFMPINYPNTAASRGRWDIYDDVNNPSNDLFTTKHFEQWNQTPVPAIYYPASSTKTGKIACDVSEYYDDVATTGEIGKSLSAMTEPTLSYRQIFDIQPAQTRAEEMKDKLVKNGDGVKDANWLEKHTIVAPAGRAFKIQPKSPIAAVGSEDIDEEHLQYIYYFRPDAVGTTDNNMGEDPGSNYDKTATYARIGKKYTAGKTIRKAKLLTADEVMDVTASGKKVVIVNALNGGNAFVLGKNGDGFATKAIGSITDTAKIRGWIETNVLNPQQDAYILSISQPSADVFNISHVQSEQKITLSGSIFGINGLGWDDHYVLGDQTTNITLSAYPDARTTAINEKFSANLVRMHVYLRYKIWAWHTREGYLTGSEYSSWYGTYYNQVHYSEESVGPTANQAWLFYEIIDPTDAEHFETPRWEKFNGSDWDTVARWDYETNAAVCANHYNMTADGALHLDDEVLPDTGTNFSYRLLTEHFQLAKFSGHTRSADKEMLKLGTIISEEDIERDYNIIFSLEMENWPAPKTSDVVAYNYHFPWDFTELGYHYPVGDGEGEIPANKRIFNASIPGKGEYCFINKFVAPSGPNTQNAGKVFECMDGAENGYMLCVNAAQKRTTIMNFEYDQLSCSGQQIYLVGNFCNPVQNNYDPQITADLEGWDGSKWVPIYRYKSGKIAYHAPSEQHWYQMALPIARERIEGYSKFRCRAEIDGAPNRNCHLLIDRLRFIEKARGFTVFQDKATCIEDDSVTVLIRLNYNADPDLYKPGKLVAYQFQKWDKTANEGAGGYVPMNASIDNGNGTYTALTKATGLQVAPGYMKDAFTTKESVETPSLKTLAKNDYGYVMIPEPDYDPNESNTDEGQSALRRALIEQAIKKLGLTGEAANARRAFINETGNVRTFDQVMNNDLLFGGATPHVKSFVKEGDNWVIYLATRLPISATQNNTFRVGMAVMNDLNDKPTFTEEACATFHIFKIKQRTALSIDGALWTNHPRSWYNGTAGKELLAANETYRASIALQLDETVFGNNTANPRCKFDLLHATENVRANDAAGNAAFEAKYGCTRTQFKDDMEAFRNDDKDNPNRELTDWTQVTWQNFTGTGRTEDVAKAIYNRLNHLVTNGLLEIGLDYRDIYMGDRADSYFYLIPVPTTGRYESVKGNHDASADTTMHASVCNDTLWLELHSQEPTAKLRFGYDSRVGDTYIVPTIRASRSDANGLDGNHLDVRVAEIMTEDPAYSTVIGWEKTELIGSNDPDWSNVKQFKYTQDKDMRNHKPRETAYYTKGDVIEFTPAAGNEITLKPGYWYQFKTPFYAVLAGDTYVEDPATPTGHSQFILAIAPDTAVWTPSHPDAANYWNDDANWTPKGPGLDKVDVIARVPMGDTRVIIRPFEEGMLPIVSDDEVADQLDKKDFGYAKNTCKEILFYPRTTMLGQEKLNYERAFVDLLLLQGQWQTFSPALNNVYSGDMYIPETVANDKDFLPEVFATGTPWSKDHNRTWPYAFYQGFYNTTVPVVFHNTDIEGNPMEKTTKSSADWVKTNVLDQPYKPGEAVILLGFGPDDEAEGTELVVRLPKQETSYQYIGQNGQLGQSVKLERQAFSAINKNLYYDKDNLGDKEGITKTLKNETPSKVFFFGNSTMAPVDIWQLCNDNKDVIEAGGTPNSYRFTAYLLGEGASYSTRVVTGPGQYFVAPQRAVGLIAKEASNSINIILKPSAMVGLIEGGETIHNPNAKHGGTARTATKAEVQPQEAWLYISAANMTDDGLSKAYYTLGCNATATRGYKEGEDALSLVSGLNYYNAGSLATPLSMYSIADNRPVMLDVRDTVSMVPLAFTTLDEHYSYDEVTLLSFATKGEWNGPLYLYDALTGDSVMIIDGIQVAIQTPENDQVRYYINHNIVPITEPVIDPVDPITTSTAEVNKQNVASNYAEVYDLLGRRVAVMQKNELIHHLGLPTGVYVIQRGTEVEKIVVR